jgi:hypothetical protein
VTTAQSGLQAGQLSRECVAGGIPACRWPTPRPGAAGTTRTRYPGAASLNAGGSAGGYHPDKSGAKQAFLVNEMAVKSGRVTVGVARLASGKGSCTVPATESGAGRVTLTASYGGAAGFAASTSSARTAVLRRYRERRSVRGEVVALPEGGGGLLVRGEERLEL